MRYLTSVHENQVIRCSKKEPLGKRGLVCGANIRRDVKISHSAVKQKDLNVNSGITVLQGGEDVKRIIAISAQMRKIAKNKTNRLNHGYHFRKPP